MIIEQVPIINGVEYTHADILINVAGIQLIGLNAIDYGDTQEITGNHSTGHKYTSVGFGPVETRATLTVSMSGVELIQSIAPGGRIQNIPFFNVGINYLPLDTNILVRHKLKNCRFKGRNPNSQVGGSQIEEVLELFVGDIDYSA